MNMKLKSNIWKFYVIAGLGMHFITPIRILYLISFGLSFAQIGMMELAAAIVIVILEIPSGIFADLEQDLFYQILYALQPPVNQCISWPAGQYFRLFHIG